MTFRFYLLFLFISGSEVHNASMMKLVDLVDSKSACRTGSVGSTPTGSKSYK